MQKTFLLNSAKNIFLLIILILSTLLIESYILTLHSYYTYNPGNQITIDSDIVQPAILSQQIMKYGIYSLPSSYLRNYTDICLFFPFVYIFGCNLFFIYWLYSFFFSCTITCFACLLSIKRNKCYSINFLSFFLFSLLASSFYFCNIGHLSTYLLYAISLCILYFNFIQQKYKYILLFFISILGMLNDDFWLLFVIAPIILLNLIEFFTYQKITLYSIPIILGAFLGQIAIKIGCSWGIISFPRISIKFHSWTQLSQSLLNTIYSYSSCFRFSNLFGTSSLSIAYFFNAFVAFLCIISLVYTVYQIYKQKDKLLFLLCTTVFIVLLIYIFIDSPTKQIQNLGLTARYLYIVLLLLCFFLCNMISCIQNKRVLNALYLLIIFTFIGNLYLTYQNKNTFSLQIRADQKNVVDYLVSQKQKTAYAEWWTAYGTWASGNNRVQIYPITPLDTTCNPLIVYVNDQVFEVENHAWILPLYSVNFDAKKNEKILYSKYGKPEKVAKTKLHKILIFKQNIALLPNTQEKLFLSEDLSVTKQENKIEQAILLPPREKQFGPYTRLNKGTYKITIQGENLLLLSFLCRSNSDNTMHELENIRKSNNIVEYFLTLPKKTFQLEFVTDNNTDFTAKIYSIKIQSI